MWPAPKAGKVVFLTMGPMSRWSSQRQAQHSDVPQNGLEEYN